MACNNDCANCKEKCDIKDLRENPNKFSSIKKVIGVVSGKGGVGKSLVTSLLATGLARDGFQIGILDADITGPSIPKIFNVSGQVIGNEYGLLPSEAKSGIKIMSSNLLLPNETDPVVWRGPIIAGLVRQFWTDVIWKDIDYLLVDMPPGTGDVPLTVFQSIGVDGIIIVTSPQELVSMIVQKAVNMAKMMNIPVLGIVENMSYVQCPTCNEKIHVFGESHVDEVAKQYNVDTVSKLPINPLVARLCDKGAIEDVDINYVVNNLGNLLEKLETLPLAINNICVPVNDGNLSTVEDADTLIIYQTIRQMIIKEVYKVVDNLDLEERLNVLKPLKVKTILSVDGKAYDGFVSHKISGEVYDAVIEYLTRKPEKKPKVLKRENVVKENK